MTWPTQDRGSMLTLDATRLQLEKLTANGVAFLDTMRSFFKITLCLCLLSCLLTTAWGGVSGSMSGTIKDASGAAITGASITLVNSNTGVQYSASTNDHGSYTFPVLSVGSYVLE